jgi:hypothetical protein
MRPTALSQVRYSFNEICFPEDAPGPRKLVQYWPLDLDIHEQKLAELRENAQVRWA